MEKKEEPYLIVEPDLSQKQNKGSRRASIRKFFDFVDKDRRGSVRKEDVHEGISHFGLDTILDLSEIDKMFADVSKDNEGYARVDDLIRSESSNSISSGLAHSVDQVLGQFTTNAERIISGLIRIKNKYLTEDPSLSRELDFAILHIQKRDLYSSSSSYKVQSPELKRLQSTEKGRDYLSFLSEYSEVNEDLNREHTLKLARENSSMKRGLTRGDTSPLKNEGNDIFKLFKTVETAKEYLSELDEPAFNILEFNEKIERKNTLIYLSTLLFDRHQCFDIISHEPYMRFIKKVKEGYVESNPYHNDVHGVDVMQGAHMFLMAGKLDKLAEL